MGVADFLRQVDCEELIEQTFRGVGVGEIGRVNRSLEQMVARLGAIRGASKSAWSSVRVGRPDAGTKALEIVEAL